MDFWPLLLTLLCVGGGEIDTSLARLVDGLQAVLRDLVRLYHLLVLLCHRVRHFELFGC